MPATPTPAAPCTVLTVKFELAAVVFCALSLALWAAPARSAATSEAAAAPQLEEIVVTATRREESMSKIAVSVTAITQEGLDLRGIKDIQDVARFTPGFKVDNSGTSNISIRGIASSGGAGTTGIYIDDTPIQMRALAFNPDEAQPKSFDIERIEVLRGPQGTLFGAGSMGGTVRYITTQPSLHKSSVYSRNEISFTQGGDPSYEAGIAVGGPLVEGTFGARISAWHRRDGGWIDRINPDTLALEDKRANHTETTLLRLAAVWAPNDKWTLTPSIYYQDTKKNDVSNYWTLYSNPSSHRFVSANPTQLNSPDKLYMPALKIEANFDSVHLISSTSYYHRDNTTGYDGTLYNLGFYQAVTGYAAHPFDLPQILLNGTGVHLNDYPGAAGYRAPATVDNNQRNFTQEFRLESLDSSAKFVWTTGLFFSVNKQEYL
ncbi:MAG: TonB-dependent receptor plug domain-containing protein, partial [Steroidobacteraceae bacterium]